MRAMRYISLPWRLTTSINYVPFRSRAWQKQVMGSGVYHRNQSSCAAENFKELAVPLPYGQMAAKAWGSPGGMPILALHGWLDNCGTFDRLLPLLSPSYYYVALDLPGHGLSSHRPPGCFYSYLDLVLDIKRVINFFSWNKIAIIGHSMGGELGLLCASIYPKLVDKLILLDVIKPYSCPLDKLLECAASTIEGNLDTERKMSLKSPIYTLEAATRRLIAGMDNEITPESAAILLKRGSKLSPDGGGVIFTRDLRIRNLEQYNAISHNAAKVFTARIDCEMLIITVQNAGHRFKPLYPDEDKAFLEIYKKGCKRLVLKDVPGNHFVHLNNSERVAPIINDFLS